MTTSTPRPEPNDSEPGDSLDVCKRIPEPVGGATELPPRMRCETLASEFCKSWDGSVAVGDVLAVITIASAVCKIAAIVVPLFFGTNATQGWFQSKLLKASRKRFPDRSEVFHEQFAMELAEFICKLPDNGVSRGEVEAMLSALQGQPPNGTR